MAPTTTTTTTPAINITTATADVATTTTTVAPTTWAPCVLADECVEAHTAQVARNTTDGSCDCECDGQWNGERCGECPWRLQQATCAACITGRIGFPLCPATAVVRALIDAKPSPRVGVPLSAAGITFWRAAAATSILQSIRTSVCSTGSASVVVAVTDARSASAGGTEAGDALGVLKLTVVVSLVQDTPGATAATGPADVAAVAGAARCISSLFGLPSRFLPLNVNATDAPRYDPQTPADSSFFVFIDDGNATDVATSPCGDVVCSSTAAANAADMPPDPAAAALDGGGGGGDEDTGTRDLIIVLAVAAAVALVVIVVVVGRRQRQAAVMRRRAERHSTGVSFADAIAAEMPLLDMPVSEAAHIMSARNEPAWKKQQPEAPPAVPVHENGNAAAANGPGDAYENNDDDDDDDVSLGGESIPEIEGSFISPSLSQRRRNNNNNSNGNGNDTYNAAAPHQDGTGLSD
jgi:hypothetical protein